MTIEIAKVQIGESIIEKLVTRGDVAGLSTEDRANYYIHLCQSFDLNPATQPIEFITFQGKMIAYFKRGATDQMAANRKVNRQVIIDPEIRKVGNADIVYCKVRASLSDGRSEEDIGTLPLKDPTMDLMKCLTKARRRATLTLLGLGLPDESEIDDMPGARRVSAGEFLSGQPAQLPAHSISSRHSAAEALVSTSTTGSVDPRIDRINKSNGKQLLAMAGEVARATAAVQEAYGNRWAEMLKTYDAPTLQTVLKKMDALPEELRDIDAWNPVITVLKERGVWPDKTHVDAEDMGAPSLAEEGGST